MFSLTNWLSMKAPAFMAKALPILAMKSPDQGARGLVAGSNANGNLGSAVSNFLWGSAFPPIEAAAVFVLVLGVIICGARLAGSGIFNDPRSRMMSIIGLVSCAVGAVLVFNAQALISLISGINV